MSNLKLFYTNCESILNKLDEVKIAVGLYDPDIICICETHLNKHIDNNEISIKGYVVFRGDRNFKIKLAAADGECDPDPSGCGGSLIYVKGCLKAEVIPNFNVADSLAISVQTSIYR